MLVNRLTKTTMLLAGVALGVGRWRAGRTRQAPAVES